jgi:hypothetical protein
MRELPWGKKRASERPPPAPSTREVWPENQTGRPLTWVRPGCLLGRARNSSQVQRRGSSTCPRSSSPIGRRHARCRATERIGKSGVTYCPRGMRAGSTSVARQPRKPRETNHLRSSFCRKLDAEHQEPPLKRANDVRTSREVRVDLTQPIHQVPCDRCHLHLCLRVDPPPALPTSRAVTIFLCRARTAVLGPTHRPRLPSRQ